MLPFYFGQWYLSERPFCEHTKTREVFEYYNSYRETETLEPTGCLAIGWLLKISLRHAYQQRFINFTGFKVFWMKMKKH